MTLQHLRSSTANKRPDPTAMADGQIALNTAAASPGLFYKDSAGNLVKAGPVHVGSTAPNVSPASGGTAGNSTGESWLDTSGSNPLLKVWNGSSWQTVQPVASGTVVSTADTGSVTSTMIANGTIVDADINASAAIADTKLATISTAGKVSNSATTATSANTASAIVARDASGNFTAGTITANLTGTASAIADSSVTNAKVSATAAIAGTKISPDFGSQNITTTGTDTAASFNPTSSTVPTNGFYLPAANSVAISTNGTGRLFVDANGRVLTGTSTALNANGTSDWQQQIAATGPVGILLSRFSNNTGPARINLLKSRSGTIGSNTIVSNGDVAGAISFLADDGTNYTGSVGEIKAEIDGVPGTGSLPGRIVFSTTPTGTNGSQERLRITSAGLVGIGTSSPSTTFHVVGTGLFRSSTTGTAAPLPTETAALSVINGAPYNATPSVALNFGAQNGDAVDANKTFQWRLTAPSSSSSGTGLAISTVAWDWASTYTTTERIRISPEGRVGIGTTPANTFHVYNTAAADAAQIQSTQNYCTLKFTSATNSSGVVYGINGAGGAEIENKDATKAFSIVVGGSEKARLTPSGQWLVGTSSARSNLFGGGTAPQLQVEGTSFAQTTFSIVRNENISTSVPGIVLGKTRGASNGANTVVQSGDNLGLIDFQGADGTNLVTAARISADVDATPGANDMPGRLVFSTTADGASSPTERMRIRNDGEVLINKTSSFGTVHSLGVFKANNALGVGTDAGTGQEAVRFYNGATAVGTISTTGSSTAYNTSSDYRLKENVAPVTDGITRLQQLKPSRFNFIADPDKTVDGFIAHEVQVVVPEAIHGTKDEVDADGKPIYQGIDQSKLVPLLTAALQEAIGEIESLKARVAALESA